MYTWTPREFRRKSFYWLLHISTYRIVNANSKWQEQYDFLFLNMGLCQSRFVPRLFFAVKDSDLEIVAVKIVDNVLIRKKMSWVQNFNSYIKLRYKIVTIVFIPGSFLFYRIQRIQDIDMAIRIHGDGKLESLNCVPIDRNHRKQVP